MRNSKLLLIIGLYVWLLLPAPGAAQCIPDITVRVEETGSDGLSDIILSSAAAGTFTFELYDLNRGEIVKTTSSSLAVGKDKTLFRSVAPSLYTVYVHSRDCPKRQSIGGPLGIQVGKT